MDTLNAAEEFVYGICKKSFLSLWSYANPRGKEPGKELCDILVVCEPDIVIFSIKEIRMTDSGDPVVDWQRWRKRAIEESCKQIYGAERYLSSASYVTCKDGTQGLPLSKDVSWRIHRVAVAIEHENKAALEFGNFGKGYVHVFDKTACDIILRELNTITDFVHYLAAKEALYQTGVLTLFQGAEEDLLALYLHQGRVFPQGPDLIFLDQGLWESIQRKPEYRRKKAEDVESYTWDRLIEGLLGGRLPVSEEPSPSFTDMDLAVRVMARENRFSRRVLGKALKEFLILAQAGNINSRIVPSPSEIAYVFLYVRSDLSFQDIQAELGCRCFIARGMLSKHRTIIGVAIQEWAAGKGSSSSLVYLHKEAWGDDDKTTMRAMQESTGFFATPLTKRVSENEYPDSPLPGKLYPRLHRIGRNALCPCGSGKKHKNCHGK